MRRKCGEAEGCILELLANMRVPTRFTRKDLAEADKWAMRPLQDWAFNNALLKMVRAGVLRVVKRGKAGANGGNQAVYAARTKGRRQEGKLNRR